jgi:hypothetical protein
MEFSRQLQAPVILPSGKQPPYSVYERLDGPRSRPGRCGEENNLFPLFGIKSGPLGRQVRSPVSIPIEQLFFFPPMALQPLLGPGLFFSSVIIFFIQTVGLLGRVISPSQGRYLHAGQHKHRINAYTDIRILSWIRTHDRSFRARRRPFMP